MNQATLLQKKTTKSVAPATIAASATRVEYEFSKSLVTMSDPLSAAAESMRALRTHILAQHVQTGRRALSICSPSY